MPLRACGYYPCMINSLMDIVEGSKGNDDSQDGLTTPHVRPLAARMRPTTLDGVVGQDAALAAGSPLRMMAAPIADGLTTPSAIVLYGPPGVGKTTIASIVARESGRRLVTLSATTASVRDVKDAVQDSLRRISAGEGETLLFLDEIHRFSKSQQDALLPAVENRDVAFIAATTENPSYSVIKPLLSRVITVKLDPLGPDAIKTIVQRAISSPDGLDGAVDVPAEVIDSIAASSGNDARRALTTLEAVASMALGRRVTVSEKPTVTMDELDAVSSAAPVGYDRGGDDHYDMASAFIKSMRGSDPDAAVYWAARMLEEGEDPRFIARRVVIAAAEEVGMANPQALQLTVSAMEAVEMVGMPEARIPLAVAIIGVATSPKSNRAYLAMDMAIADVKAGKTGAVPKHLLNATSEAKKTAGYGIGYKYAHDWPGAVVRQQYLPDGMEGTAYYLPSDRGREVSIGQRLEETRKIVHGEDWPSTPASSPVPSHDEDLWKIGRKTGSSRD